MKVEFEFVEFSVAITYKLLRFIWSRIKLYIAPNDHTYSSTRGFTPRRDYQIEQRVGLRRALILATITYILLSLFNL